MNSMTNRVPVTRKALTSSKEAGFTLIEVLVTAVILAIGILGLAGLQYTSLQGNQGAQMNTVAVLQSLDASDRLRSNPLGVTAGDYDNLTVDTADVGCITTGCSPADLAAYDYWIWNTGDPAQPGTGNAALLPSGEGVICLDATPNDGIDRANHGCDFNQTNGMSVFAIKVWWDDDRNPETNPRRHVLSVLP